VTSRQKELLAVAAVGAGLSMVLRYTPILNKLPLIAGALMYTGGYIVREHRPAGGWKLLEG